MPYSAKRPFGEPELQDVAKWPSWLAYAMRQAFEGYPSPRLVTNSNGPVAQSGGATDF